MFSASHWLVHLPKEHPCSRLHGHNYTVVVELRSHELDERGFVMDYRELDVVKKFIDEKLDHRHLGEVLDFPATAENLAKYLFDKFRKLIGEKLYAVEVCETPKTMARYEER